MPLGPARVVIGEAAGRDVGVLGDEIAKGGTVLEHLQRLREVGPRSIRVARMHGLLAAGALKRLNERPETREIGRAHTVRARRERIEKLRVLAMAPALAERTSAPSDTSTTGRPRARRPSPRRRTEFAIREGGRTVGAGRVTRIIK